MFFRKLLVKLLFGILSLAVIGNGKSYADQAEDYVKQGLLHYQQNKFPDSIADYSKAIELNPQYAPAYYNRANLYNDLYNYDLAIADYTKTIELDRLYVDAYYKRGELYFTQKKNMASQAMADFDQAIKMNPHLPYVYYARAVVFYQLKKFDKSLVDLHQAESLGFTTDSQLDKLLQALPVKDIPKT